VTESYCTPFEAGKRAACALDVLERAADDIRKAMGADILPLAADVSRAADCAGSSSPT